MAYATDPTGRGRKARTLTAADPLTGAVITRRTDRVYVGVIVTTCTCQKACSGGVHTHAWVGRPDLAAKQLAKWGPGSTARLAPVVEDPWAEAPAAPAPVAEPAPAPVAEPAPAPVATPEPEAQAQTGRTPYGKLTGQAVTGFARFAHCYRLTAPQAQELAAVVWRWAGSPPLMVDGAPYCWIGGSMAQALARRGVLAPRATFGHTWHPEALAILQELAQAQAQAEAPLPCSAEGVAAEALAALAELGATPEPTPAPQAEALTEAQEDLALALAWEDLSPEALQGAQEDLALALAEPTPRPCLPGEALPPEPPAWGGPAPELPTLRPLRTPAELRADADSLQAEAAQALQALARIPALRRSAPDIRSMAQQLGDQAARLRGVAAAREAQAQARPLAPVLPTLA